MAGPKKKKEKGSSSSSDDHCQNCDTLQEILKTLQETNKSLQDTVKILTDRLNSVEETLNELTSQKQVDSSPSSAISSGIEQRVQEVEELLEERTNRQLRKTLVIRGVSEGEHEKSWQDTEILLSKIFSETLNIPVEQARGMIDRCHRGGNPNHYKKIGKPRPIFAAMYSWKACEDLLWNARKKKNVFIDYKFGPKTTTRRNLALQKRRELLNQGTLCQAHVAYPARLMGKGKNDKKYRLIEDFSKADVSLKDN